MFHRSLETGKVDRDLFTILQTQISSFCLRCIRPLSTGIQTLFNPIRLFKVVERLNEIKRVVTFWEHYSNGCPLALIADKNEGEGS